MELLVSFVIHMIDMINICLIVYALKKEKVAVTRKLVFIGGLWVVCGSVCAVFVNVQVYKVIIYMITLFFIYIIFSRRIYEIIELFMINYVCLAIIQSITVLVMYIIKIDNEYSEQILGQMLTFIITLITYYKNPLYKIIRLVNKSIIAKIMGIIVFSVLTGFVIYLGFEVANYKEHIILIIILFGLMGIIFWDVVVRREKEIKQKNELDIYKAYLPIMDDTITDIRAKQHEVDNKYIGISSVINASDDVEYIRREVKKYLNDMTIEPNTKKVLKSGHKVIEAFIFEKTKKAKEKQIKIESQVIYKNNNEIAEDHMIIQMLGILIDNAIEANDEDTQIDISVIIDNTSVIIEVANEHERINGEQLGRMFKKEYSTKISEDRKKRGYGLYNLSKIVKGCSGEIILGNQVKSGKNYVQMIIEIKE